MASRGVSVAVLLLFSCNDGSSSGCGADPEDAGAGCTEDGDCLYCCVERSCDSCNYPSDLYECAEDSECQSEVCHQGACMECADDSDCDEPMGGTQCVQIVAGEPELHCGCLSDLDCVDLARGTKCIEGGSCGCIDDDDCADEKWCNSRECFPHG